MKQKKKFIHKENLFQNSSQQTAFSYHIRSLVCEQSSPTREQRLSLKPRYYRLVGPSVWECTCCRAGLWLRRDTGGGVDFFVPLSVSCHFVWNLHSPQYLLTHIYFSCIFLLYSDTLVCLNVFSTTILPHRALLLPICWPPSHYTLSSSLLSCRSLLPSILQMLVAEQYPRGHDDWLPPSLWSLPAIVLGPTATRLLHSMNCTHIGLITNIHCSTLE